MIQKLLSTEELLFRHLVMSNCFVAPWSVACQAPLTMGFFKQEYWSGLPFPSPGDLPDPGRKPASPAWQADSLPSEPPGKPSNTLTLPNETGQYGEGKQALETGGLGLYHAHITF